MLNRPLDFMASSVLLGVAMLKLTAGAGCSARDVKEDIVMARGVAPLSWDDVPGGGRCVDVHTTTECVRSRIRLRNWWDRGIGASPRSPTSIDDGGGRGAFVPVVLLRTVAASGDTVGDCCRTAELWKLR